MEQIQPHLHNKYAKGLLALVLIMVIVALGAYSFSAIKETKYIQGGPATITVNGKGEVFARPDIGTFSFSVYAEGDDASSAQQKSADAVNKILDYLKSQNIDDKDIKTQNYSLNPRYEYMQSICNTSGLCPPGQRVLKGYEANQTIQVKVRDLSNAGTLISGVGTQGATNISSLQFTIDDEEAIQAQAREKAIADAETQAKKLAGDLGVELIRITGFSENNGGVYPVYAEMSTAARDSGVGGGAAPQVPTGENTFTSNVTLTYEIE